MLYPPEGAEPKALVHFLGGAFLGAAPQLAYRPLLEALAARGALVSRASPAAAPRCAVRLSAAGWAGRPVPWAKWHG